MKRLAVFLFCILAFPLILYETAFADQPCPGTERCEREGCYWCTPMDITDEASVWKMLCSPITVITGNQKEQVQLRSEPDKNSEPVADVTCASQGVHVLEQLSNGWTRVEVRSSSFKDSTVKAWNKLVTGYVETKQLKEITPDNRKYAVVIDKLTQRCYIFRDGSLFSTLLCSTGKPNASQPYNETQSGEFLIVSPTGDFNSDELVCEMGLRFNRGNLLHQVPYILSEDGTHDFSRCEPALGTRASHGCIRVQRKATPDGINMTWLWNNRNMNCRLVIWEDIEDRTVALPDATHPVYINRNGGKTYHSCSNCSTVADRYLPLIPINYIDLLNTEYISLKPCTTCIPPERPDTYVAINTQYATTIPLYTDDLDGAYYHQDPYCPLYSPEDLPLRQTDLESISILAPCPECIVKAQNPTLYYNPSGGKYYHSDKNCRSVNNRYCPMTPFEYAQLDEEPFRQLRPCDTCGAPARDQYPIINDEK